MRFLIKSVLVTTLIFHAASAIGSEHPNTLKSIEQSGKIKVGYRMSEPPMSFIGRDGKPTGYSIDICNQIVGDIKTSLNNPDIKVEYVPVNANDRFTALSENKIDILCGATTKTLSRSKVVDFTQLTFVTGASVMTLVGQEFNDFAELNDEKVGVVQDTTTLHHLKNLLKESYSLANIQQFNSSEEALEALRKGDIAAYAADQVVLIGLAITTEDGDKFSVSPNVFSYEPLALVVRRNDADFMLLANKTISKLSRNRQIFKLYGKWFGVFSEDMPPLIKALYKLNTIPE